MKLLFVGDFRPGYSSGYTTILEAVCSELAGMGHEVTVLGTSWGKEEHHYPFRVIPSDYTWVPVQVLRLHEALAFDHVILAMDVPKIEQILRQVGKQELVWPLTSGLFPIESKPLVSVWKAGLDLLHKRFVISKFGKDVLEDAGLDSIFIPMTATRTDRRWSHSGIDSLLEIPENEYHTIVLTVADNQERKDLPVIGQAVASLEGVHWALVTASVSPHGWYLPDLLSALGIDARTTVLENLSQEALSFMYILADVFVLASQAEGACLPLYEAMLHGLPCVAPNHTAITEALADGRGVLIDPDWISIHPWGNVNRFHVTPFSLARGIEKAKGIDITLGRQFVEGRTWQAVAECIEEELGAKEET